MYLLSVFRMSDLSLLSAGGMDALGHSALRELVVLPTWAAPGLWVWTVMGLIGCVGLLGLATATARWRQTGNRSETRPDRLRSSRSARRARVQ